MSRLFKYAGISLFAVALLAVVDSSDAKAQGFSLRVGGVSVGGLGYRRSTTNLHVSTTHGYSGVTGGYVGVKRGYAGYIPTARPVYGTPYGRPVRYFDTSHYRYQPPTTVRYPGGVTRVPGHYRLQHSGVWHP